MAKSAMPEYLLDIFMKLRRSAMNGGQLELPKFKTSGLPFLIKSQRFTLQMFGKKGNDILQKGRDIFNKRVKDTSLMQYTRNKMLLSERQ